MDFSCGPHEFISKVCHNERVIAHTRARMLHVLDRTCSVGLESVPSTFVGLFRSHNFEKKDSSSCDNYASIQNIGTLCFYLTSNLC